MRVGADATRAAQTSHVDQSQAERTTTPAGATSSCAHFQQVVNEHLIRHRSILDVLSKCQESAARVNRAVVKAVTVCGCVQVTATAQQFPADGSLTDIRNHMSSHLSGELCEHCREVVEVELGRALFYFAAVCNLFNIPLETVIDDERRRVTALGIYNLT